MFKKAFFLSTLLFSTSALAAGGMTSTSGQCIPVSQCGTGATTASAALANLGGAPLASPSFSGTVSVPTAGPGDTTTKAANTLFVASYYAKSVNPVFAGTANFVNLTSTGNANIGGDFTVVGKSAFGTNTTNSAMAVQIKPNNTLSGTTQYGLSVTPTLGGTSDDLGVYSRVDIAAGVAATNVDGIYIDNANKGAGASIATQFGLYMAPLTAGTTNWGLYSPGSQPSYHQGNLYVGSTGVFQGIFSAYSNSVAGGAPQTSGATDVNTLVRFGGGSATLDFGIYASGAFWMQPRIINNNALNGDLYLNPNGGATVTQRLLIGGPTASGGNTLSAIGDSTPSFPFAFSDIRSGATNSGMIAFVRSGSMVGSISTTNVATNYNTSSDGTLKEDFKSFSGLEMVMALKPYDFRWKATQTRDWGFVAQEAYSVVPTAVTPSYGKVKWSMDYGKLTPILTSAIQEQQEQIHKLQVMVVGLACLLALLACFVGFRRAR